MVISIAVLSSLSGGYCPLLAFKSVNWMNLLVKWTSYHFRTAALRQARLCQLKAIAKLINKNDSIFSLGFRAIKADRALKAVKNKHLIRTAASNFEHFNVELSRLSNPGWFIARSSARQTDIMIRRKIEFVCPDAPKIRIINEEIVARQRYEHRRTTVINQPMFGD